MIVVGLDVVAAAILLQAMVSHDSLVGLDRGIFRRHSLRQHHRREKTSASLSIGSPMVKVVTIVIFLVLGAALLFGRRLSPRIGFANYTAHGGFFPKGWGGVGLGVVMAVFSFMGLEIVGATRRRSRQSESGRSSCPPAHLNHPRRFLSRQSRPRRWSGTLDRHWPPRKPLRPRLSKRAHPRRHPHHEFAGAHRRTIERHVQSVFHRATCFSPSRVAATLRAFLASSARAACP